MKLRNSLFCALCLLSVWTSQALANGCWLTKGTGSTTISILNRSGTTIGPVGGFTVPVEITSPELMYDVKYLAPGDGVMPIKCGDGNDNSVTLTAGDASLYDSHTTPLLGTTAGLLKTNIPGIVYTYQIICMGDCHSSGAQAQLGLAGPPQGKSSVQPHIAKDNVWAGGGATKKWQIQVDLYQTPEYRPHNGQTEGHALPGTIGTLRIGKSTEATMPIIINTDSITFKVSEPTCQSYSINDSMGNTEVNLGIYHITDFTNNDQTVYYPFTFDLYRCFTNKITLKVTGKNSGSNADYLVNDLSGEAEGLGLALYSDAGTGEWQHFKTDGSQTIATDFTGNDEWYMERHTTNLAAVLTKIGTVRAGEFQATATITINYE